MSYCISCGDRLSTKNKATKEVDYNGYIMSPAGIWCVSCWKTEPPKEGEEHEDFRPHCTECGTELTFDPKDSNKLYCSQCLELIAVFEKKE